MHKALVLDLFLCVAFVAWLPLGESSGNDACLRGDGKPGYCIHYRECSKILNMMTQRNRSPENQTYVRNSRCPVYKRGFVCCEEEITAGVQILLDQECGRFGSIGLTIGGREIAIKSRPWMALLKYNISGGAEEFLCGGTLITNRFILTAAHCLQNSENKLVSVRLGEHRISTETDCSKNSRHQMICAPPVENFGVDRVFVHESYSAESGQNDIALIKLSTDVKFKENMRPICLPVNRTLQGEVNELPNFRVTGWGSTEQASFSDVPTEVFLPRKNRSECGTYFNKEILDSQLCAGKLGKDSCNGDSGGPLMYSTEYLEVDRFVQFGVVSYGSRECGNGVPGVYTNLGSFIPWIADKLSNN